MRISEELFFAPRITFSQLDLSGEKLPCQLKKRIDYFFLQPAHLLLQNDFLFAAGVLLVSCIDFLAKIRYPNEYVGIRIQKWCEEQLPSISHDISNLFSDHFRNGLVHEARIKNGGEFSRDAKTTAERYGESLRINPILLYRDVSNVFNNYIAELNSSEVSRKSLVDWVEATFEYELNN